VIGEQMTSSQLKPKTRRGATTPPNHGPVADAPPGTQIASLDASL